MPGSPTTAARWTTASTPSSADARTLGVSNVTTHELESGSTPEVQQGLAVADGQSV